jgi:hypothetical protein
VFLLKNAADTNIWYCHRSINLQRWLAGQKREQKSPRCLPYGSKESGGRGEKEVVRVVEMRADKVHGNWNGGKTRSINWRDGGEGERKRKICIVISSRMKGYSARRSLDSRDVMDVVWW